MRSIDQKTVLLKDDLTLLDSSPMAVLLFPFFSPLFLNGEEDSDVSWFGQTMAALMYRIALQRESLTYSISTNKLYKQRCHTAQFVLTV